MANGDAAAAAGMPVVPGTADLRDGYDEINLTRDLLANHQTAGTHSAAQIASGVLAPERIPAIGDAKITDVAASKVTGAWSGDINTPWTLKLTGAAIIIAQAVYSKVVTGSGSYRALYVNQNGEFGYVPSARRMKKNLKPAKPSMLARLLEARVVEYDYLKAYGGGHDIGLIADELDELGLGAFVIYDEDAAGTRQVAGIHYERLTVPLLAIVQQLDARLTALEQKEQS